VILESSFHTAHFSHFNCCILSASLIISHIINMCILSLFLQLEDCADVMYSKTVAEDGLEISTPGDSKPRTVVEYVQAWRNQIWDYGFIGWFRGKEAYSKTRAFQDHRGTDLAVKRVIYRYVLYS
jgi:hypothetical protein